MATSTTGITDLDALRRIPIKDLAPLIGATQRPGFPKNQYFTSPQGTFHITPREGGDLFIWNGGHAPNGGRGAINFVLSAGLAASFSEARALLERFEPPSIQAQAAESPKAPQAFVPPRRIFTEAENRRAIIGYLSGARKIPADVLQPLIGGPHPAIYAGWGDHDGKYLVFPMRDHTSPDQPMVGAVLRYRGDPPEGVRKAQKRGEGASRHGWWQLGPYPAPNLVITEAPIDALALWSALPASARTTTRILATGGNDRPKAPGVWHGVERLVLAQDGDAAGQTQAKECAEAAQAAGYSGSIQRLAPPPNAKDWAEVWEIVPDAVRRAASSVLALDREEYCR